MSCLLETPNPGFQISYFFSPVQVIEKESAEVEAMSKIVRTDEEVATQKASEAQALKNECESDLAAAIPALEEAMSALNTLKVRIYYDVKVVILEQRLHIWLCINLVTVFFGI